MKSCMTKGRLGVIVMKKRKIASYSLLENVWFCKKLGTNPNNKGVWAFS